MSFKYRIVSVSLAAVALTTLTSHGQGPPKAKVAPKLEPIAETRLLMEGLAHANFRGLERNLLKNPIDDQSWVFARGQALLIAETANLLMLRPPKSQGQAEWFDHAMSMRNQAVQLAQRLAKKDVEQAKFGMSQLANSCNRCHQTFRVPVDIVPFPAPDAPPVRKV